MHIYPIFHYNMRIENIISSLVLFPLDCDDVPLLVSLGERSDELRLGAPCESSSFRQRSTILLILSLFSSLSFISAICEVTEAMHSAHSFELHAEMRCAVDIKGG